MKTRLLEILGTTLRLRDESGEERGSRALDEAKLSELLEKVKSIYTSQRPPISTRRLQKNEPADARLQQLGRELYQWLDGTATEQWLSGMRRSESIALHIDVESRLRNLPWELLFDGAFLCSNPVHLFTPVYRVGLAEASQASQRQTRDAPEQANRPLRVLFMAASAEGVKPVLAYEEEERLILEATANQPIELEVEESGNLDYLAQQIADREAGYFDVVHLSGHAEQTHNGPRFILEDEFGGKKEADAQEIAKTFKGRYPRLLFLSGCETGKAGEDGALPSLAEALVRAGCPAVLGWALPVGDVSARHAAAVLYAWLAENKRLDEAVAAARQKLLEDESPHWHLLRLYADDTPLTPFVTPRKTKGREKLKVREARTEFLDAGSKVEVCDRKSFVGRRRLLQKGLRILQARQGDEEYGEVLVLTGMGGLGKSSLAARLAERLRGFKRVVIWGAFDDAAFRSELRKQIVNASVRPWLEVQTDIEQWIRDVVHNLDDDTLFIFDDFEQNRAGDISEEFRPTPIAAAIVQSLARAITQSTSDSRIIVTSRYGFALTDHCRLHEIPLYSMREAELAKKLYLLREPQRKRMDEIKDPEAEKEYAEWLGNVEPRIIGVAAGNPRLLDRLYKLLEDHTRELDAILGEMEQVEARFREDVLLDRLVAAQSPTAQRLLAAAFLIGIPLHPREIREILPDAGETELRATTAAGLLEHYIRTEEDQWYYASPLLAPYVEAALPQADSRFVQRNAAVVLHKTRWQGDGPLNDAIADSIHRMALAGGEYGIAVKVGVWLSNYHYNRSSYREAREVCERTLEHIEDYRILHNLARAEEVLGDTYQALGHYQEALKRCPPVHPQTSEDELRARAVVIHNLGGVLLTHGVPHQAMALCKESLEIYEKIGDVRGKAATLHSMGVVLTNQGEIAEAMALWKESLEIKEAIGEAKGKAATLHSMAVVLAQQGEIDQAMGLCKESLEIQEKIGDGQGKAETLYTMAVVLLAQGEIDEAMGLWKQALGIHEESGDVRGKAATLHNMAVVFAQQGEIDEAMRLWKKSLSIHEESGDVKGKAATLHGMAGVLADQGEIDEAMAFCKESLDIREQIGDVKEKAATLHEMGRLLARQGEMAQAMSLWKESLEIHEQFGDVKGKAATLANMAFAANKDGRHNEALELNREAAALLLKAGAWPDLVTVLGNMGGVHALQALWLALRVSVPAELLLNLGALILEEWSPSAEDAPLLAWSIHFMITERYASHPKQEELSDNSRSLAFACAAAREIPSQEGFNDWVEKERLNDPDFILPALDAALRKRIPDEEWMFDPARFDQE